MKSRDELLKMLDLEGKEATPAEATDLAITSTAEKKPARPASPTALALDDWALRRGRDVLADSGRLRELGLGQHAIADFHGCAFEPAPQLKDDCVEPRRREFIEQLLQTPEYQALHTST